jgi:two-component system cell cycle response regulator
VAKSIHDKLATPLTTKQVLFRIIIIISTAELLIMQILGTIPHEMVTETEAILDSALLIAFSTPAIYLWVIKPFVADRDDALAQLHHLAHIDPLTQLANRRLLSRQLQQAIASIIRHKIYGALLLLDLDRFKPINDNYGHGAGDAVLVEIARRMESITRSEDVVARLGGDEFLVFINHLDSDEKKAQEKACQIANNLIALVNKPLVYKGDTLQVGASIGIRILGFEELDTETAIREADIAMYRAKESGRGRAVIYQ